MSPKNAADGRHDESRPIGRDPRAVASYVATLTSELTDLARRANLVALAYFLDMARIEAQSAAGEDGADKSQL